MRVAIALLLACFVSLPVYGAGSVTVASPDGRVQFRLSPGAKGLEYTVTFGGKPVIEASAIGVTVDRVNLAEGADTGRADAYHVNETYPWYGNHSTAVNNCNGVRIAMTHRQSRLAYTLEVRAYNDGIAFRHVVPGEGTRVPDEATMFRIPSRSTVWFHDLEDHYEGQHLQKSLDAVPPGQWLAPPVTFRLPDETGYLAITEGALRNYSGMGLQADGAGGFYARLGHAIPASYPFRLRFPQDVERLTKPASIAGTITTPWRIVMIGADLNALVNCDIVHNVAPPPDPKFFPAGLKTDWIQPGRSLWSYLDGGNDTVEGMKQWADYAKTLGFEYNLLEDFWSKWPESELKELVDYSRQRGVKLIVWRSRSELQDEKSIREMFELLKRTGVAGVKIDFFDHEHKEVIDRYEAILRLAAEYHLLVDFHGANKPTGNERTWPNQIGLEGIRGMEAGPPYAMHEVTLPFTRMLAGLADYTPMHFSGGKLADTTWAHQVANAIILQAPLLVFAAHPVNILANPAADLIKSIPSTWDETVVLPVSVISDVAAFARRKGDRWFLAVNNGPVAKTVRVDLSFLGKGSYVATLVRDTGEASAVKIETVTADRSDPLYIELRSGGGFVGRFVK